MHVIINASTNANMHAVMLAYAQASRYAGMKVK